MSSGVRTVRASSRSRLCSPALRSCRLSIALAFDMFVAMETHYLEATWRFSRGLTFFGLAMLFWYMLEWIMKRKD